MIDGAVGSPSLVADDSLLIDGWESEIEAKPNEQVAPKATPISKQQQPDESSTMTPITPHSANKIALDIIEDYAGWE